MRTQLSCENPLKRSIGLGNNHFPLYLIRLHDLITCSQKRFQSEQRQLTNIVRGNLVLIKLWVGWGSNLRRCEHGALKTKPRFRSINVILISNIRPSSMCAINDYILQAYIYKTMFSLCLYTITTLNNSTLYSIPLRIRYWFRFGLSQNNIIQLRALLMFYCFKTADENTYKRALTRLLDNFQNIVSFLKG